MNEHELIASAVIGWMSAKFIELLKRSSMFPWLSPYTETMNAWVARLVAFIAAFGVHASFDSAAGTLMITGITANGIGTGILEYARQKMFQEIAWQKFVKKDPLPIDK